MTKYLSRLIDRSVEYLIAIIFAVIVLVGALQIFNRFILNESLSWTEELQIYGHIWIVFLAIPVGYRKGSLIAMDMFSNVYPERFVAPTFRMTVELMWGGFALCLIVLAWRISEVAAFQTSPGLEISMRWPYLGLVFGGAYLLFVCIRRILFRLNLLDTGVEL
ncbi:TRAP transporter small permease [Cohaesibacter haloalkalitolerans]|uniref:TRAP transporter small permease n=1 Tax=Cohaesibacter haloalkalitolerans TaxID=1162980 RepID=UPI000E65CEE7|nr:TRAP transporter small permease [Cohaesibacter haloalkalitolerans]